MPLKRKVPSVGLERRVRPRREDKWEPEPEPESFSASEQTDSDDDNAEEGSEDEDQEESEDGSSVLDETKARRAYAFLDDYRETEMADLRAQIKKTKDPADKDVLKRQLLSMESRKKAQQKKDEERALLAEHRAKEKELVAQGKTPFYLKRSEQKKQLLVGRYEKMSKKQVDRAIERKRKKVVGKEKKELGQLVRRR
ncbi:rRNA biogenesis protein rrp36 [Claviceps africana]|uniref:rRNA biogenesis protein RRP36 n=1 Tax=Claviceps africana TaxID=83212 RepID=A0A8K0J8M4_9HYPO|nr:rRNA biogenesis protein rrp36 [Claviceps africana]